jgi:large subunit ribosomal protein L16
LKMVGKQPIYPNTVQSPKMRKRVVDMRGPELVHNQLIHKQYGIVALSGGEMKYGHFEMVRSTVNRSLDIKKSFAIWRVDPPWKAVSRHGQGKKLGGGKGEIAFWTTPVKRGRVIVEVGGIIPRVMIERTLIDVAQKLPFPAKMVSQTELEKWQEEEKLLTQNNINKLRWEWCIKNNILNVINYVGKYDIEFSQYGPDCR